MMPLTSEEIKHLADSSAKAAVRETLLAMGVDVSKPEAVKDMQLDFAHVRRWRESVDTVRRQSIMSAIAIVVAGIAGAIWMALRSKGVG